MNDSLGDRMKKYEAVYDQKLTPNSCLFIRVDGKAFHTFTRGSEKPFDSRIMNAMTEAAEDTANEMQGFKLAYVQSDECTFMLGDYDTPQTEGWFGYRLNKVVSIAAAMYSVHFNHRYNQYRDDVNLANPAYFDARAFIVPKDDAPNVFVWRQQDWARNSIQMLAQSKFSHKQLHGKNTNDIHEMLHDIGVNWTKDCSARERNGTFITPHKLFHNKLDYDLIKALI